MKTLFHLILLIIMICSISCGGEDSVNPEIDSDQPENTITTPCDFDISGIAAGSTTVIDCVMDLEGDTITLPANVVLDFAGGDIIDGMLVFTGDDNTIDGRILNSTLEVGGNVKLKDPTFTFYAVRWDIVEGSTTSDIALNNNENLEKVMFLTRDLGATTFLIDKLDAYFEVTKVTSTTTNANWYASLEAINIPSDFNLEMTENTHLRIFPGGNYNLEGGAILAVRDASNITVTGGNLHGDRDERYYSPDDVGLEGSHLFHIHSGKNIVVDGVNFENGSKGTFSIYSFGFSFNDTYIPTENVTIKNCVIKNSRRMGIALTDGRDIRIENNTFINAGQASANSDGGEVGYAINLEPARTRDDDGNLKEYQRVFDVLISGNTETNSRGGFLTLTIGQDITVEDNNIDTRMVWSLVSGVKIRNNTFKALDNADINWAFFAAGSGETVFDNEFSGNTIEGYNTAIILSTVDVAVYNNDIKNCSAGIQFSKTIKTAVYDNVIDVENNGLQASNTYNDQIEINGNTITSGGFHMYFTNLNQGDDEVDYSVNVDNNVFFGNRAVVISKTSGVTFSNNEVIGGIEIGNSSDTQVISNQKIQSDERDGIRIYGTNTSVTVSDNIIVEPTGAERYTCINNNSDNPDAIIMTNNTCQ